MSESCSFCEQLPAITQTRSRGRAGKCPVCREPLWTTPDSITYRVVSSQDALPTRSRTMLVGGLLCVTAIGLLIGFGAMALRAKEEKPAAPPTPIARMQVISRPSHKPEVAAQPQAVVQTKPAAADDTAQFVQVAPGTSSRSGETRETLVRADITYLRQDFSVMQHGKEWGKWPAMQRFDFLVRARELTAREQRDFVPLGGDKHEYKQILCDALTAMTGKTAGPTAQSWRRVLADETIEKSK